MKIARGLPLFSENQAYVDGLILNNLSSEEIPSIVKVESAKLEKSDLVEHQIFHCIYCGNITKNPNNRGMCDSFYLDYNIKISKFVTKPIGGGL